MNDMVKYFKLWKKLSMYSFQTFFITRVSALLFLTGKILRVCLFLLFIIFLVGKTRVLASYNTWEVLLFYMTFNLVDAATQMLFREVYRFREYILSGRFDLFLIKPVNVLFRSLLGWTDFLDFVTLIPFVIFIGFIFTRLPHVSTSTVFLYFLLLLNTFFLAASFHIFVLGLAVLTTEIDNAVMIYRDVTNMGKFPIDIYTEPLRGLITFVIPVGVMMSYPPKALLGLLSFTHIAGAFALTAVLSASSIWFWKYSLKKYSSASS